ncbi:cytochrome P460 family protein [Marinobacterium sedimentorum]|uniref:cytochrome P460 family protein n=1 Tax=Marinobacterium sedimentorum TaxID=2927804 RepID=UPI0020C66FF9|nr:cytochrome P460 family protein [Marinobacterium sedimentorum]MCP8686576.1 cytochrome P460 family protein [Marinobacterium sedimentorum]
MNRMMEGVLPGLKTALKAGALAALLAGSGAAQSQSLAEDTYSRYVDASGSISLPQDFRLEWTHLGSWVVSEATAPGAGFHDVYTQAEAARSFREKGVFPDGAVLIKEIRSIESGAKTTGPALWARDPVVWFVMVKDNQARFDNPHWGEGWGWALFKAGDSGMNASASFAETCKGCHLPAQQNDWVFTEGYPTLQAPMVK